MENNPITKFPEGLDYLEKNIKTVVFFPRLGILKGLRKQLIRSYIITIVRQ